MATAAIYQKRDFKQLIYSANLNASQKAVMYYFIDIANPHRSWTCFPSHAKIAQVIGRSVSTVKRAITELIRRGFLTKLAQFRRYGGFQSSNLYTLFVPDKANCNDNNRNKSSASDSDVNKKAHSANPIAGRSDIPGQINLIIDDKAAVSGVKRRSRGLFSKIWLLFWKN